MDSELKKRIEERAHRLWEEAGKPEGEHQEHWDKAEREIADEEVQTSTDSDDEMPGASEGLVAETIAPAGKKRR